MGEEYEQKLMHHNTVGRARLHNVDVPLLGDAAVTGLDRCYDCAAFASTVRSYLAARNDVQACAVDKADVAREVRAIIEEISESGRTLATPYHVSSSRHGGRQFLKRSYVDALGNDCFNAEGPRHSQRRRN